MNPNFLKESPKICCINLDAPCILLLTFSRANTTSFLQPSKDLLTPQVLQHIVTIRSFVLFSRLFDFVCCESRRMQAIANLIPQGSTIWKRRRLKQALIISFDIQIGCHYFVEDEMRKLVTMYLCCKRYSDKVFRLCFLCHAAFLLCVNV